MTISEKLQELKRHADRNEDAPADDLTDLSSEVYVLSDIVELLAERLATIDNYAGPDITKNANRTLNRVRDMLGVSNE